MEETREDSGPRLDSLLSLVASGPHPQLFLPEPAVSSSLCGVSMSPGFILSVGILLGKAEETRVNGKDHGPRL